MDTLGRRYRETPTPTGLKLRLTDRDVQAFFSPVHRHGDLSASTLAAFAAPLSRPDAKRDKKVRERLGLLYHEDDTPHGGRYLDRVPYRSLGLHPWDEKVYTLTTSSERALKEANLWSEYAPKSTGTARHDHLASTVTASIELSTRGTDVRYISQDEALARIQKSLSFKLGFYDPIAKKQIAPQTLRPDGFFGLEYTVDGSKKYRWFMLEFDRGTETNKTDVYTKKSFLRNLMQYHELIGQATYKDLLGLTAGLVVLVVTTQPRRMQNMVELAGELSRAQGFDKNTYMWFQCVPDFGDDYKPGPALTQFWDRPWKRYGCEHMYISQS